MDLQKKEHRDIHQQMQLSQAKLHEHFENIKDTANRLKSYFGDVQQREGETELLRQKYYDMLTTKSYNEADRDAYFELEQTARDVKDMYVHESQKLTYKCSTYVVFSYQHSEQREQLMTNMLKDVDKFYLDCENLKKERAKLTNQCGDLQKELQDCYTRITQLERDHRETQDENGTLTEECTRYSKRQDDLLKEKGNLERKNANLDSTVADMKQKNSNLTDDLTQRKKEAVKLNKELENCHSTISKLNEDIERRKKDEMKIRETISKHVYSIQILEKQTSDLISRNTDLSTDLTKIKAELAQTKRQREKYQEDSKQALNERSKMKETHDRMKRDKEHMEEQYTIMKHERDLIGKEKDRLVSREYRAKKRNQELTEDHKFLTREVDDLREKYRRADERVKKDGSLKQELRDTIKRLHKEMEEERRKMIKVSRDVRIQTDPGLACESRDIAIQHAQYKMKQALRVRDQHTVENKRLKEIHERSQKALEKKTHELGLFETKFKTTQESFSKLEEKFKRAEKLLNSTKNELEKEKASKKKMEREDESRRVVLVEQVHLPAESSDASCQTVGGLLVSAKEAELTLNLALCLQKRVEANKAELAQRLKELDISKLKIVRLEKIIELQKSDNETLQRKTIHMEGKFFEERSYMRGIRSALISRNLRPPTIDGIGVS